MEMALVKLSFATKLEAAYLEAVRPQTIKLLSTFSCLRSCHLRPANRETEINMSALQQLCSLESLGLIRGCFADVPIASCLTALYIAGAQVTVAEGSVCSALSCLEVCSSVLEGLHTEGLLGCKNLQSLMCRNCKVSAAHEENYFQVHDSIECFVPTGTSQLTRLTCLHVDVGDIDVGLRCPDFAWTFQVRSLHSLTYKLQSCDTACDVLPQLTLLTNLEQLDIDGSDTSLTKRKSWVGLLVDWSLMSKLQKLEFRNGKFEFRKQILGLSKLTSLKSFSLDNVICRDPLTVNGLVVLVTRLREHCPAGQDGHIIDRLVLNMYMYSSHE